MLVPLVIQHEKLMRHIVVPYFPHCLINGKIFGEKSFEHEKYEFDVVLTVHRR
jgi:hypothetical protein